MINPYESPRNIDENQLEQITKEMNFLDLIPLIGCFTSTNRLIKKSNLRKQSIRNKSINVYYCVSESIKDLKYSFIIGSIQSAYALTASYIINNYL